MNFDPSSHLMKLKGKDYLEVKWRLVWLRAEHPEASIDTQLYSLADGEAVFKATVAIPNGGTATGWGSEESSDFGDFLEKAETKALGRALAALGYGTQFTDEWEFSADGAKVVDSPVERGRQTAAPQPPRQQASYATNQQNPAHPEQASVPIGPAPSPAQSILDGVLDDLAHAETTQTIDAVLAEARQQRQKWSRDDGLRIRQAAEARREALATQQEATV